MKKPFFLLPLPLLFLRHCQYLLTLLRKKRQHPPLLHYSKLY